MLLTDNLSLLKKINKAIILYRVNKICNVFTLYHSINTFN